MKIFIKDITIPSVNHYFKSTRWGVYVTKEAKEFKQKVRSEAIKAGVKKLLGKIQVSIVWYAKLKGRGDLDNKFKCILDSLNNVAYEDDSQITKLTAEKKAHSGFDGLEIEVKEA